MTAALERLPGVKRVAVSLEHAEARVEFDDSKMTIDRLVETIGLLGFRARLKAVENSPI
ncbi:MAG: heavy-metal-associated domain-containing protein [Actinobacteria bacterium]|nr:MAG: heavy-metal-associated domain-containing protein [Actinomycetota bacterium]